MKKSIVLVSLLICTVFAKVSAQLPVKATNIAVLNTDSLLSKKIANKMADSLKLSKSQKANVLAINQHLSDMKARARKEAMGRATLGKRLQQIEGMRDTLYKDVLEPAQFEIYRKAKRMLINNTRTDMPIISVPPTKK